MNIKANMMQFTDWFNSIKCRSFVLGLILTISFLIPTSVKAQTYPVQSSLQIAPPYSLKLSDYVSPGTDRMVLNALLNDFSVGQFDVKLRLTIEGQGIRIQTSSNFRPNPITLVSGVSRRLSGLDLEPYLRLENLDFLGIGEQEFGSNGGMLPEGIYRFCIDVLEVNRDALLARTSCTTAWLVLNDPPIINLPEQSEKLVPIEPQYVRFQWTPRHTGSPNSAFTTEYDFTLVEIWPTGRNPNDAILTTTPIYETTTAATSLVYGPSEPALVRGRHYAFRVQARSVTGVESLDLFRNDGYSEVQHFIYGDECIVPENISVTSSSSRKIDVYWDADPVHTGFLIKYRQQGGVNWMEEKVLFNNHQLTGLIPDTNYEVELIGLCGSASSDGSKRYDVRTPAEISGDFSCGTPIAQYGLDNKTPLPTLNKGDVVMAGDFDVAMVEVSGSNGTFSGKGQIVIPMMNHVKAGTSFTNIRVNDEYRMYAGEMDLVSLTGQILTDDQLDDVQDALDFLEDIEEELDRVFDLAEDAADSIIAFVEEMQNEDAFDKEAYEEFISDDTGIEELKDMLMEAADDAIVAISNGDIVEAAKQISVAQAASKRIDAKEEQLAQIDTVKTLAVRFVSGEMGMDEGPGHNGIEPFYYKIVTETGDEYGPWFSSEAGQELNIDVEWISNSDVPKDSITFIISDKIVKTTSTSSGWNLTIPSGEAEEKRVLKAIHKGSTVGIAGIASYNKEIRKVTLVKLNGAKMPSMDEAQRYLNDVYGPSIVEWEVATTEATIDNSWDLNGNGSLYLDESNDLSVYPVEVKALNSVVKAALGDLEDDRYYMLFTDIPNSGNVKGFMPRKMQFGLVFDGNPHTLAHELGHGAFRLSHTWEDHPNLDPGGTENLMDYTAGNKTRLRQYQWDEIHDPKWIITLFDDEDEAASVTVINIEELKGWEYNDAAFAFLSPAGETVLVPKNVKSLKFSTGDKSNPKDPDVIKLVPFGTLVEFNLNGNIFSARWNEDTNEFTGYYSAEGDESYIVNQYISNEQLSTSISDVIVGTPIFSKGGFEYKMYKVANSFTTIDAIKADNYLAKGSIKPFDFITEDLTGSEESKVLSSPPSFALNTAAIDFVKYYAENATEDVSTYEVYLYTHATLLDHYGMLNSCFSTGIPGEFLRNIAAFSKMYQQPSLSYLGYQIQVVTIPFPDDFEVSLQTSSNKEAFKYLMSKWSDVDINYYSELQKLVDQFKQIEVPDEVNNENIEATINLLKEFADSGTDNFDCLFDQLSNDNKKNIFKQLLSTSKDDFWNDNFERIVNKLLQTLTEEDLERVFADFRNDPQLLLNAYNKLDNFFGSYLDEFMYSILNGWNGTTNLQKATEKYPEIAAYNSRLQGGYSLTEEDYSYFLNHPEIIFLEDEKVFTGTQSDLILEANWKGNPPLIDVFQDKDVFNSYGKVLFGTSGLLIEILFDPKGPDKDLKGLNPLDPVPVYITTKEAQDLNLRLEPGIYAVPAIFIYWIRSDQDAEVTAFYTRIALDALAIALAPFTGGGSAALITLEIGLAATDIVMTLTKEQLSMEDSAFQQIYGYWDNLYMAYGVTLAGAGLFHAAPSLAQGAKNTMRLVANPRLAGRVARMKLNGQIRSLQGQELNFEEFVNKLLELSETIIKSGKVQWATYANELKKLSFSLSLNAELRYFSSFSKMEGYLNPANADFLFTANGENYLKVFEHSYQDGVHTALNLRYLRDADNVTQLNFVGQLDNIRYADEGDDFTRIIFVEDAQNPNSVFVITEKEIDAGISKIENFDEVVDNYKALNGLTSSDMEVRGVSKLAFEENVSKYVNDPEKVSDIYSLWKNEEWGNLEKYFIDNQLNKWDGIIYPPNDGFIGISKTETSIPAGRYIDRFGGYYDETGIFKDRGRFVADADTDFGSRALPESTREKPLWKYEVIKEIPEVKVGEAIPWFGQPGKGKQYLLSASIDDLIEEGYLIRILDPSDDVLKLSDDAIDLTDDVIKSEVIKKLSVFEETTVGREYTDLIVHSNGSRFFADGVEISLEDLVELIPKGDTKPIRLLSCNDINSAQDLAIKLNREVIANGGITRVHKDGGLTVVSGEGSDTNWYRFYPDKRTKSKVNIESKTAFADEYIELGKNVTSISNTSDLENSIRLSLSSKGIDNGQIDEIILNGLILDEILIDNNRVLKSIDNLTSNPKYRNPTDLNTELEKLVKDDKVTQSAILNQLNEYDEGVYWMSMGEEVWVSKEFGKSIDEIDVRLETSKGIVECKRVSGGELQVGENMSKIIDKFKVPSKLSSEMKQSYPRFIGQLRIDGGGSYKGIDKAGFIEKLKGSGVIGDDPTINKFSLDDLKMVEEWHIVNGDTRFIIHGTDWY